MTRSLAGESPHPESPIEPPPPPPDAEPGSDTREELARTRAQLAALSTRLSHDMQSALCNVSGFAACLRSSAADRLAARELHWLDRIECVARRGAAAARDLMALSAVSTAKLHRRPVDVVRLAKRAMGDLRSMLQTRDIEIGLPDASTMIDADVALVRLAIWHLLSNAVKFTAPVAAARIQVDVSAEHAQCMFAVRDNGVGFDPAYAHKLFNAFERLHHEREFEGTGIGLAVVKEVAFRHGGRVGAEPLEGGGSRFWFSIPCARAGLSPPLPPC